MRRFAPLLALTLVGTAAGCGGSSTPPVASLLPSPSAVSSDPQPSAPVASGPVATGPARRSATTARALYYLHADGSRGPLLYREFHPRPATTAVIRDAVTAMLTEKPLDADYTSLWPGGTTVRGARVSGSTAYIDLSARARRASAGGAAEAASLQQLVYTVTAAAPAVRRVQLLIEGHVPSTLWGHVDTRSPMARGPAIDVLGPVWLTVAPTIARGARFGGEASVFEATVSWEFRQAGRVVKAGHTNATTGAPGRGSWSAVADVPPGSYVLRAYESSAKDGTPTHIDDKPVTVRS
jgi:hypothetical protein